MKKLILTILILFASLAGWAQRLLPTTSITSDAVVATRFWRSGTLVYLESNNTWNRTTQDWNTGVAFSAITSVPSAGADIISNANELIMNVAGTVQGQSNLIYDGTNNNLTFGTGSTNTAAGTVDHNFILAHNSNITGTGNARWLAIMGENNDVTNNTAGNINNSFLLSGFNNSFTLTTGNIFSSGILGGENNTLNGDMITSTILGSSGSSFSGGQFYSSIVGGQNIDVTSGDDHTIYMPKLRVGRGTSGTLVAGANTNSVLGYNATNGDVTDLGLNIVPIAPSTPGLSQDGQGLQWDNTAGNWVYGGGDFWPLTGTASLTGAVTMSTLTNNFTMNGGDNGNLYSFTGIGGMVIDGSGMDESFNNIGTLSLINTIDGTNVSIQGNNTGILSIANYNQIVLATRTAGQVGTRNRILLRDTELEFNSLNSSPVQFVGYSGISVDNLAVGDITADQIVSRNTTSGALGELPVNSVAAATTSPGAGQDGQVLQWDNNTTNWTYTTVGRVQIVSLTLSNAQILALNSTPIEVIPAPGADRAIVLVGEPHFSYDFGTAAFGPNDNIEVLAGTELYYTITDALNGSVDTFTVGTLGYTTADRSAVANQPINVSVAAGNPTLGDGTGKLFVQFYIIDL